MNVLKQNKQKAIQEIKRQFNDGEITLTVAIKRIKALRNVKRRRGRSSIDEDEE